MSKRTKTCECCSGTGIVPDPLPPIIKCEECGKGTRANSLAIWEVYEENYDCGPNGNSYEFSYNAYRCPKCKEIVSHYEGNTEEMPWGGDIELERYSKLEIPDE